MIKKNKLSIFLLAVVAMLTVYYIKNPSSGDDEISVETTRYYQDERDEINDERETQILNLESIISKNDINIEEKEKAINEMALLSSMTENEIILETKIIDLGYKDCLVEVDKDNSIINISLLTNELTTEQFIEISKLVCTKYSNYKINLNYESI